NPSRLLVGGSSLQESLAQGNTGTWRSLAAPVGPKAIGIPAFQGTFVGDSAFPLVTDKGATTYDPDTIYITDGDSVYVTKNHGTTWSNRTTDLTGVGGIVQLVVDPRNRDTVYAVRKLFGSGHVFVTTDAGLSWSDISYNLPNLPSWSLVLDPRNNNLYLGNDTGVWLLPGGSTTWRLFGTGMPNAQVRDLDLNQTTNISLAGTHGRGVFQMFLDDGRANAGALRAVSGTSTWTGPVYLNGTGANDPVWIGAEGTQAVQNGISTA